MAVRTVQNAYSHCAPLGSSGPTRNRARETCTITAGVETNIEENQQINLGPSHLNPAGP
mgnify:CR=1 FL=1